MLGTAEKIVVEQPFDWVGSVLVPVVAVLISALLAIAIASAERRAARKDRLREGAAALIRALNEVGRSAMYERSAMAAAAVTYLFELNALTALLNRREVVVAKWVCVVMELGDPDLADGAVASRHAMWVSSAVEGWARGTFKPRDFVKNMPEDTSHWVDQIRLRDWGASSEGGDVFGMLPIAPIGR